MRESDKIAMMEVVKEKSGVVLKKNAEGKFFIERNDPSNFTSPFYMGNGSWGSSKPMIISSLDRAGKLFDQALAIHLTNKFIIESIRYYRHDMSTDKNVSYYYGVTLKAPIGRHKIGTKFNHIRWNRTSPLIKICNEDDTVIETIEF